MATVGSLRVLLTADTSKFAGDLKRGSRSVSSFTATIQRGTSRLMSFAGAFAGIAGGAGLAMLIRSVSDSADELAKLSDRTGIAAESLVALQHHANLSGTSAEELTRSMERMLRSLDEASMGTGESVEAFQRLGLSAAMLKQSGPEAAMRQIADAVKGVEDPISRAAIVTDIFGRAGQKLLPMLMAGSAGFDEAAKKTRLYGAAIDRDGLAKIEAMNDAFTDLVASVRGRVASSLAEFAPAVLKATERLIDMSVIAGKLAGEVLSGMAAMLRRLVEHLGIVNKLTFGIAGQTAKWVAGTLAATFAISKVIQIGAALIKTIQAITKSQVVMLAFTGPKGWAMLAAGAAVAATAVYALNKTMEDTAQAAQQSAAAVQTLTNKLPPLHAQINAMRNANATGPTWHDFTAGETDKVLGELSKQAHEAGKTSDELAILRLQWLNAGQAAMQYAQQLIAQKRAVEVRAATQTTLDGLRDQAFALEYGADKLERYRLYRMGATAADLEAIRVLQEQNKAMQDAASAQQELQSFAESTIQATMTPLERYNETISKLGDALREGYLSWDQYARGVRSAREELEKQGEAGPGNVQFAQFENDSIASAAAREIAMVSQMESDKQGKLVKETNTLLAQVRDTLRSNLKTGT